MRILVMLLIAVCAIGALLGLGGFYYWKFHTPIASGDIELYGQIGDFFGGSLNPIFSLLSFLALLYTINIQLKQLKTSSEELALSRKELELTREELARTATAQNEAQLALNKQAEIAIKASLLDTINFLIDQHRHDLDLAVRAMDGKQAGEIRLEITKLRSNVEKTYTELIQAQKTQ